jgi:hypothetical protein
MDDSQQASSRQAAVEKEREEFWSRAFVPVDENWQESGTEFVNPVVVADMFAAATAISARLAQEAEIISEKLAKLEYEMAGYEREVAKIRRTIFADNYSKITKSAGSEIQDAFVLAMATNEQRLELTTHEEEIATRKDKIGRLTPRLDRLRYRLRVLEKNMEWAKQYLDFDKMLTRINMQGRG